MDEITTSSFDDQLKQMMGEFNVDPSKETSVVKKKDEDIELDAEDLEGLIECPFDAAAMVTGYEGFELSEKESRKLCKLYVKPLKKLAEKYGASQLSILLALTTTMSITVGKYVEYKMWSEHKAGNEGKGQDKLSES